MAPSPQTSPSCGPMMAGALRRMRVGMGEGVAGIRVAVAEGSWVAVLVGVAGGGVRVGLG